MPADGASGVGVGAEAGSPLPNPPLSWDAPEMIGGRSGGNAVVAATGVEADVGGDAGGCAVITGRGRGL